ncbi:STE3-like pheromone receptor [Coniophora puteana RWD-64-598 SS2]|uniref:STE3-like pheromone receptor n=1 Tax=Coniophora puteana (strain RWD-64-598) TaxID=741705 RepID=A0A5M3M8Z8_CONPW|nr:STE3-like pheromone receptor [Coniophora puteana RWD-64-598 SS2]EIW75235.1 STE3-like pheromone receptor [Coniophora puteana RWD-64-598 SS2]
MCLTVAIDAIVWSNNITDWAPVWCDIASRLAVGGAVAIPTATLCITRRLYQIQTLTYRRERALFVVAADLCMGLGIPVLSIAIYYVTQTNRYLIVENVGCYPAIGAYGASIILIHGWPLAATIVSSIYSGQSLYNIYASIVNLVNSSRH